MVSQLPPTEVGLVFESLQTSSRVAELEAEIAHLKEALARRQQIGVATGLLAQRFGIPNPFRHARFDLVLGTRGTTGTGDEERR